MREKFLDVRRNCTNPVRDWPAAWRQFLRDEREGRFARPGPRRAPEVEGNPNPVTPKPLKLSDAQIVSELAAQKKYREAK